MDLRDLGLAAGADGLLRIEFSEAYKDVVGRFLGETLPMRFTDAVKPGFFKRLFGGK